MPELTPEHIAMGLTTYVVLLFSLSVHESAHAWMAHKLGDDTALAGARQPQPASSHRPHRHRALPADPDLHAGIPFLGWAKPTPYNPHELPPRRHAAPGPHAGGGGGAGLEPAARRCSSPASLFVVVRAGVVDSRERPRCCIIVALGIQLNVVPGRLQPGPDPAAGRLEGRVLRAARRRSASATTA